MKYIKEEILNLDKLAIENKNKYSSADPFPHIVLDNFFNNQILDEILKEFPKNLEKIGNKFNNKVEKKLSLNDSNLLSYHTNNFLNFLNSNFFNFLQKLTSIKEKLVLILSIGGGLHELRNEGYLNIHSDFNLHPSMKLDRRLNILSILIKIGKIILEEVYNFGIKI